LYSGSKRQAKKFGYSQIHEKKKLQLIGDYKADD
jgi:hypothetical protein